MTSVGEYVQEAIDRMSRGDYRGAFAPALSAVECTIRKSVGREIVSEPDVRRYLEENWALIAFMGMPRALPLPMNIPFGLKKIVPAFSVHGGVEDIVALAATQTVRLGRLPDEFAVNSAGTFEIKDGQLLLPIGLVNGILGSVIFDRVNSDGNIGDEYWISVSDFKMFISELWGRADLAKRIMKFYLERD
jgi:hypothetical protein